MKDAGVGTNLVAALVVMVVFLDLRQARCSLVLLEIGPSKSKPKIKRGRFPGLTV